MVAQPGVPDASSAKLNALALRLFGWLMLIGGGLLLVTLAGILLLPHAPPEGQAGFALPGTAGRHMIGMAVVPILAGCAGVLTALGLISLWCGRHAPARRLPLQRSGVWRPRRAALILVGGLTVLTVALLRR